MASTLHKSERLHSKKLIEKLFAGKGSKSLSAFPLRIVYRGLDTDPSQILVSVPKRCLHRANKRNLVKRQVREAYRKNKGLIEGNRLMIAFIWLDSKTWSTAEVEERVKELLSKVNEKAAE